MKDKLKLVGEVEIIVQREGYRKIVKKKNLFVDVGLSLLAELLANNGLTNAFGYIALGNGTTAPANTDTALENELIRTSANVTHLTGAETNKTQFEANWDMGAAEGVYTEAGIFNLDADGDMLNRITFAELTVTDTDTLLVRWKIVFQNV